MGQRGAILWFATLNQFASLPASGQESAGVSQSVIEGRSVIVTINQSQSDKIRIRVRDRVGVRPVVTIAVAVAVSQSQSESVGEGKEREKERDSEFVRDSESQAAIEEVGQQPSLNQPESVRAKRSPSEPNGVRQSQPETVTQSQSGKLTARVRQRKSKSARIVSESARDSDTR